MRPMDEKEPAYCNQHFGRPDSSAALNVIDIMMLFDLWRFQYRFSTQPPPPPPLRALFVESGTEGNEVDVHQKYCRRGRKIEI